MTNVINLNKKRKLKKRADNVARATENRLKYGRTKQEKLADTLKAEKLELHLRAHKRETTEE